MKHVIKPAFVLLVSASLCACAVSHVDQDARQADTQVLADRTPLALTIPADFRDVTSSVFGAPHPALQIFCNADDGQLLQDSFRGLQNDQLPDTGCFYVRKVDASAYDPAAKRFSFEADLEGSSTSSLPHAPGAELKLVSFAKRDIRGRATLSLVYEVAHAERRTKGYYMFIAGDRSAWLVLFAPGKNLSAGSDIWNTYIKGL